MRRIQLSVQMALFCSPCKLSILSLQSNKKLSFQRPFMSITLNSTIPICQIAKVPILTSPFSLNTSFQRPKCCSSSSSSQEHSNATPPVTIIFVKGLPLSTSEGRLEMAFSEFGDVSRVKIITDKKTKQSLGFAYIWFTNEEAAQKAIKEMNGKFLDGRFISVMIAKPGSCVPRARPKPYKF